MDTRTKWLHRAEILDALRIMPRFMLIIFLILYVILAWEAWGWFILIDPTLYGDLEFALIIAFPTTLLTAIGGMITKVFLEYMRSGRDWNAGEHERVERCPECHKAYDDHTAHDEHKTSE